MAGRNSGAARPHRITNRYQPSSAEVCRRWVALRAASRSERPDSASAEDVRYRQSVKRHSACPRSGFLRHSQVDDALSEGDFSCGRVTM